MRSFIIILLFLLTQILGCGIFQKIQSKVPKPDFKIESIQLQEVSLTGLQFQLISILQNPYNTSLPYSKLDGDLLINGRNLTKLSSDLGAIGAKSTKKVPLDINIRYTDLLKLFRTPLNSDTLSMQFKGNVKLPVPENQQALLGIQEFQIPVDIERLIPNFQPDVTISNFSVDLPNLQDLAISATSNVLGGILGSSRNTEQPSINAQFDLLFSNQSPASFIINQLNFNMNLEGVSFLKLSPSQIIQDKNTNLVKIQAKIPITNETKSLVSILQKREAKFELIGNSKIEFPGIEKIPAEFKYNKTGQLKIR